VRRPAAVRAPGWAEQPNRRLPIAHAPARPRGVSYGRSDTPQGSGAPRRDIDLGDRVERLILALRTDFGCLVIAIAFVIIMISTIVFADFLTPPASNPFV
jgi:hypothetical protein